MYIDKELMFSQNQKITVTASSTNTINLENTEGQGMPVYPFVQVVEAFAGLTSLIVHIQSAKKETTPNDGDFTTIMSSKKYTIQELAKTQSIGFGSLPPLSGNYLRIKYEVEGTATKGAITAGIALDKQA